MSLDKQTLINQATPDANISELQAKSPKLYQAIKNLGEVIKTIINLSPLSGPDSVNKYTGNFTAIGGTPLMIVHNLETPDIIVSFYDNNGLILASSNLTVSPNKLVVTFSANQKGRVVVIG